MPWIRRARAQGGVSPRSAGFRAAVPAHAMLARVEWTSQRPGRDPRDAGTSKGEVMSTESKKTPWYLWPFVALWRLVTGILVLTGRLVAVILGLVFVLIGALLSATVVGAIVGVPLILFGGLLVLRGLF